MNNSLIYLMNSIPICNVKMRSAVKCKAAFFIFTNYFFCSYQQVYIADSKVSGSVMAVGVLCWWLVSIQAVTANCTVHLYLPCTTRVLLLWRELPQNLKYFRDWERKKEKERKKQKRGKERKEENVCVFWKKWESNMFICFLSFFLCVEFPHQTLRNIS